MNEQISKWQVKNPDQLASKMTKREQFCLAMRVPKTGDAELDAIIREGNRLEFAKTVMQKLNVTAYERLYLKPTEQVSAMARDALFEADALLAELEKAG